MRSKRLAVLLMVLCLFVCGCQAGIPGTQGAKSHPSNVEIPTTLPKRTEPALTTQPTCLTKPSQTTAPTQLFEPVALAFEASYVRIFAQLDIRRDPIVALITSVADLQAHCAAYADAAGTAAFQSAIEKYDEPFFAKNSLVLLLKYEGSGSVRHEVTGVTKLAIDQVTVAVNDLYPQAGSDDVAYWYILIEVNEKLDSDVVVSAECSIVKTGA